MGHGIQNPTKQTAPEEFGAKVIDLVPSFDIQSSPHIQRLRRNEESSKKHVLNRFKKVRRKGSVMIEESVVLDQSDLVMGNGKTTRAGPWKGWSTYRTH